MIDPAAFPRYDRFAPSVDIRCVTPAHGGCIHRFFDTSPFSPSGRYLAVVRLPSEDREPTPGDAADVLCIDLTNGETRTVGVSRAWEPQLGCHLNWGADDHTLLFNDVEPGEWEPFVRAVDPATGVSRRLPSSVYHASPDGQTLASADLTRMRYTQRGYGVVLPVDRHAPRHRGLATDDGLWLTDVATRSRRLAASIRDLVAADGPAELRDTPEAFEVYGFHSKWSPSGDRVLFSLRWFPAGASADNSFVDALSADWNTRFAVYTLCPDGSDIRLAVGPDHWARGGHHINFFPDGTALSTNLGGLHPDHTPSLARVDLATSEISLITPAMPGSGHPTVHPGGGILTDVYATETALGFGDGTTPLRWIDPARGVESVIARIDNDPGHGGVLRLDPHPAWDRTWRYVAFNAMHDGARRVFVADMAPLLT